MSTSSLFKVPFGLRGPEVNLPPKLAPRFDELGAFSPKKGMQDCKAWWCVLQRCGLGHEHRLQATSGFFAKSIQPCMLSRIWLSLDGVFLALLYLYINLTCLEDSLLCLPWIHHLFYPVWYCLKDKCSLLFHPHFFRLRGRGWGLIDLKSHTFLCHFR